MLETASPSVIANFAAPGNALEMLSRFFSNTAVTEFSFSSVGANLLSLSCTNPDSCWAPADVLASNSTISCRRATRTWSRSSELRSSLFTCWLRSERIPVTSPALLSSWPSDWLRPLRVRDSRVSPSKAGPSCGAIWLSVADNVSSDWFSDPVLVPAVLVVRSLTASVSEYGDDVRDTGIRSIGCIMPLPADSRVSIREPSSVPVLMCAVVSDPSGMFPFSVNVTSASPWRRATFDTEPTLMPDTVTSLPGARPPASENSAWYLTEVANETSRSGDKPTRMTSTIKTAPMNPALISSAPRYLCIGFLAPSRLRLEQRGHYGPALQIRTPER